MKLVKLGKVDKLLLKSSDGATYLATARGLFRLDAQETVPQQRVLKSFRTKKGAEDYIEFMRRLEPNSGWDRAHVVAADAWEGEPAGEGGFYVVAEEEWSGWDELSEGDWWEPSEDDGVEEYPREDDTGDKDGGGKDDDDGKGKKGGEDDDAEGKDENGEDDEDEDGENEDDEDEDDKDEDDEDEDDDDEDDDDEDDEDEDDEDEDDDEKYDKEDDDDDEDAGGKDAESNVGKEGGTSDGMGEAWISGEEEDEETSPGEWAGGDETLKGAGENADEPSEGVNDDGDERTGRGHTEDDATSESEEREDEVDPHNGKYRTQLKEALAQKSVARSDRGLKKNEVKKHHNRDSSPKGNGQKDKENKGGNFSVTVQKSYQHAAHEHTPSAELEATILSTTFKSLSEARAWQNPDPTRYTIRPMSFFEKKKYGSRYNYIVDLIPPKRRIGAFGNRLVREE